MMISFFQVEELRIRNCDIMHIFKETNIYGLLALSQALCLVINTLNNSVM